ncbi:DUF6146 family protein [Gramella sp. AN32]|uniref:DUF6146 family protein n=1 Tax=Christiangramia antarctica TaxID=2058158 RepID=A0ABW5X7Y3_9FLAO|nr:hypothetical protein [Gramella sp. AN32]
MKNILYVAAIVLFIASCGTTKNRNLGNSNASNDTVRIANDSLEYEIIIIEPGFNSFINSYAKPRGYFEQNYLENKNRFLVTEYNQRVRQPLQYNSNLYLNEINYDQNVDYGYEVNYLLYNYFVYFSRQYNQSFGIPTRI